LADKQAAKLRRRENREQREREKASRTGDSPAQKAEQTRRRNEASADENAKDRSGRGNATQGAAFAAEPSDSTRVE
jgi:hypothetical protein